MPRLHRVNATCVAVLLSGQSRIGFRAWSTLCSLRKNPLPFPYFRSGHMSAICARLPRERGVIHKRVETAGVYLACARAASAHVPALRRAQLPAESQRQNSRPLGTNTPAAVRVPRSAGAEKDCRPSGANTLAQFVYPAQLVLKKAASRIGRSATRLVYPAQPMQGNWLTYLA